MKKNLFWFDRITHSQIISDQKYWSLLKRPQGLVEFSDRPYFPDGPISWDMDGLNFNHHHRELPPVSKKIIRDTVDNNATLFHKGGFKISKLFRSGKFGQAHRAYWNQARCYVALKIYSKSDLTQKVKKEINHELEILHLFKHSSIIAYFGVVETKWKICHIFEWMTHGTLLEYIDTVGTLDLHLVRKMFSQIVAAVVYVHNQSYAHRDIKLEHILVGKNGDIRLTGFRHSSSGYAFNRKADNSSWPKTTDVVGAKFYLSPEALTELPFNPMLNDVWSLGVVLFAMLFRKFPFSNQSLEECQDILKLGFHLPRGRPCPNEAKQVFVSIFCHENARIRSYQLEELSYIQTSENVPSDTAKEINAEEAMEILKKTIIEKGLRKEGLSKVVPRESVMQTIDLGKNDSPELQQKHRVCSAHSSNNLFTNVRPDFYFDVPREIWKYYAETGENLKRARLIKVPPSDNTMLALVAKYNQENFRSSLLPEKDTLIQDNEGDDPVDINKGKQAEKQVSMIFEHKADYDDKQISHKPSVAPL